MVKNTHKYLLGVVLSGFLAVIAGLMALPTIVSAAVTPDSPATFCSAHDIKMTQRNWFFYTAGLDFGANADAAIPTTINNRTAAGGRVGDEGSTVVNDINGNLLFWTDGNLVWGRDQQVMPNGTGLGGNPSAVQSTVSFPAITNPNRFFVISNAATADGTARNSLVWSMIDMSLNNGMGDVMATNRALPLGTGQYTDEALIAIPNSTGNGFWVVAHTVEDTLVAWEFDENGPKSQTPVISPASTGLPVSGRSRWASLALSPDMTKLAYIDNGDIAPTPWPTPTEYHGRIMLFDVNATSGAMTQTADWTVGSGTIGGYSVAWSPSGNYLYSSSLTSGIPTNWQYALLRYDATSGDSATIKATEYNVIQSQPTAAQQDYYYWNGTIALAPNDKIYIAGGAPDSTEATYGYLHVINNPDDVDPGFQFNALQLPGGSNSYLALPQFATGCVYTPPAIVDDSSIHIVTFDPKGGTTVPTQTVMDGDDADEPIPPTLDGRTFNYWYVCSDATLARYDFSAPVYADLDLCALWNSPITPPDPDPVDPKEEDPPVDPNPEIPNDPGVEPPSVPSTGLGAIIAGSEQGVTSSAAMTAAIGVSVGVAVVALRARRKS